MTRPRSTHPKVLSGEHKPPRISAEKALQGRTVGNAVNKLGKLRRQKAFLIAYAKIGVCTQAAKIAGINLYTHYHWMHHDEEYAKAFEEARQENIDSLEAEAIRRARDGVERIRFHQGKPIKYKDPKTGKTVIYVEHEYSDRLLQFLLESKRPEVYRRKVEETVNVPALDRAIEAALAELDTKPKAKSTPKD